MLDGHFLQKHDDNAVIIRVVFLLLLTKALFVAPAVLAGRNALESPM